MQEYWDDPGVQMKADKCSSFVDSVITLSFFSDVVEDGARSYLVLIVDDEESKCHLDEEIFVPQTASLGI